MKERSKLLRILAISALSALPSVMSGYVGTIEQSTSLFPVSRAQLPRFARPSPLAEQSSAGFSVLPALKGGASLQPVRHSFGSNPEDQNLLTVHPTCGPAPDANSLACYNLATGETLADLPLPGHPTTTPQYHDGAWYVGTSRGFFIRYDANGVLLTPSFGVDSLLFHGPDARSVMKSLVSVASPSNSPENSVQSFKSRFRGAWNWYVNANAEFVGTPQFGSGRVFVLTANQSLNAYDLQSGKLLWGVRLAPEVQLRLSSTSLVIHERGLLVGTSDGNLLLLDPKTGQSLWRHPVMGGAADRFQTVSAPVLALSDGIVVSNAESVTQRLNWETRSTEWSYGVGSVVKAEYDEGAVFVAGSDGALHKLDLRTGLVRWRTPVPSSSPLVALTLLKKQNVAFVATANGSLFALDMDKGFLAASSDPSTFGPVTGDFFAGRNDLNEVCLSYRTPGYTCWTWNAGKGMSRHAN